MITQDEMSRRLCDQYRYIDELRHVDICARMSAEQIHDTAARMRSLQIARGAVVKALSDDEYIREFLLEYEFEQAVRMEAQFIVIGIARDWIGRGVISATAASLVGLASCDEPPSPR